MSEVLDFLFNCFLLIIPIFLLNGVMGKYLPRIYSDSSIWDDIPQWLSKLENISRILVFTVPIFFPLTINNTLAIAGLFLYFLGLILYLVSWVLQIRWPQSTWSQSLLGIAAPAYTPLVWLVGIALIAQEPFFDIPYHFSIYLGPVLVFVTCHVTHAVFVGKKYKKSGIIP